MRRCSILVGSMFFFGGLLSGCGGTKQSQADDLAGYFPDKIETAGLQKFSEVRTFVGDSLWQYIDGGAELYHTYGFVKVSTADYRSNDAELVLDLYQFKTPEGAYGLYSALRPDDPSLVTLGVEGYVTGSSLEFVRDNIMARVMGFEESEAVGKALRALAGQMANALPGTTQQPAMFSLFPSDHAVANTDKIIGASYLGQSFLNMIYTRDYQFENEKLTLFMVQDSSGATFANWVLATSDTDKAAGKAAGLPFDENYCLLVTNNYYGQVLAGLRSGHLAGVVNYTEQRSEFVSAWLNSLSK